MWLLACVAPDEDVATRKARPADVVIDSGAGDTAEPDTGAPPDTGALPETGTQACWLGPARDHAVCVPTVAYDAEAFGADYDYPASDDARYLAPARFVDLDAIDPALEIAPNFALDELLQAWKGRYAVLQGHLVDVLQDIRDDIGEPLYLNSGYRSPAYNASVDGASLSRHMYGDAADMTSDGYDVEALGVVCEQWGAAYVGLYEDGHTHCDWRDDTLDPAFYDATRALAGESAPPAASLAYDGLRWTAPATGFDEGEPFRRWTATDADGAVLLTATGRAFVAPAGTARVSVRVGGRVWAEARP
jgi:hypothetical protein